VGRGERGGSWECWKRWEGRGEGRIREERGGKGREGGQGSAGRVRRGVQERQGRG
jgi:hypothetical protein